MSRSTKDLDVKDYINNTNVFSDASAKDYLEVHHFNYTDDSGKIPRTFKRVKEDDYHLEISMTIQAAMKTRVATYTFYMEPISVERIDVLESKLRDLQEEVGAKYAEVAGLQDRIKQLENPAPIEIIQLQATAKTGHTLLWTKVDKYTSGTDGVIRNLAPGTYLVTVVVSGAGCNAETSLMIRDENIQTALCGHSSYHGATTLSCLVNLEKDDFLSVTFTGSLSGRANYLTLARVGMCSAELAVDDYVDHANSLSHASAKDYVEVRGLVFLGLLVGFTNRQHLLIVGQCFRALLDRPEGNSREFTRILDRPRDEFRLKLSMEVQALTKSWVATYAFVVKPVSAKRVYVLESELCDLQEEGKRLRDRVAAAEGTLALLQDEMRIFCIKHHAEIAELEEEIKQLKKANGVKVNVKSEGHVHGWEKVDRVDDEASTSRAVTSSSSDWLTKVKVEQEEYQQPKCINFCIQDQSGEQTFFKMKRHSTMDKSFSSYAQRKGVAASSLRFLLDGERVFGNETPDTLKLKDQATVHCTLEQVGGFLW
ncbi:unnamed protein product [Phytophthora lilii]|uniref:Unnamed protein product n=1 Tax=Phytophthora lilii TaxID=2077276 RepID=A0A9W6TKJ0_9STRA|nr:unnamed protein product [Phytophthora lilii]